jgi:hypothetical protein
MLSPSHAHHVTLFDWSYDFGAQMLVIGHHYRCRLLIPYTHLYTNLTLVSTHTFDYQRTQATTKFQIITHKTVNSPHNPKTFIGLTSFIHVTGLQDGVWREGITVCEHTSHPSNTKTWHPPHRFAHDSSRKTTTLNMLISVGNTNSRRKR